ncbi:MAG: copper amine oxidase-like protein [Herbinix sp.]|jgi:hypothetical protein|nr:copper amine oxidase-like protein [Herbinix sp.]
MEHKENRKLHYYHYILSIVFMLFAICFILPQTIQAETVSVSNTKDFKSKLQEAVEQKVSSFQIKVTNYSKDRYSEKVFDTMVDECEISTAVNKNYIFTYSCSISGSGSTYTYRFQLTYTPLDGLGKPIVVSQESELRKALSDAVKTKADKLSIIKYNYSGKNEEELLKSINNSYLLEQGYYGTKSGVTNYPSFDNIKIQTLKLTYELTDMKAYPMIKTYEELLDYIEQQTGNKKYRLQFIIKDYDPKEFYLGKAFYEIDHNLAVKRGYSTKLITGSYTDTTDAIFDYYLSYPQCTKADDLKKNGLVLTSSKEWYQRAYECLENMEYELGVNTLYSYPYGKEAMQAVENHPEYIYDFYVSYSSTQVSYRSYYSKQEIKEMRNAVDAKVSSIITKVIKKNMTDREKAKAIHDYIVTNCEYDYKNYKNNTLSPEVYTAYGALINKKAVCQGYSAAFNLLAKAAGIKSITVSGTAGGPHAWNFVLIDGKYVYIDTTWDDPVYTDGSSSKTISYKYFAVSAKTLAKDHTWVTKGLKTYVNLM